MRPSEFNRMVFGFRRSEMASDWRTGSLPHPEVVSEVVREVSAAAEASLKEPWSAFGRTAFEGFLAHSVDYEPYGDLAPVQNALLYSQLDGWLTQFTWLTSKQVLGAQYE